MPFAKSIMEGLEIGMEKHIPLRMCVGCREMKSVKELIRVVKDFETGDVGLDLNKKKFGRGAYICRDDKCLKSAEKKKAFERIFKGKMTNVYDDILSEINMSGEDNDEQ